MAQLNRKLFTLQVATLHLILILYFRSRFISSFLIQGTSIMILFAKWHFIYSILFWLSLNSFISNICLHISSLVLTSSVVSSTDTMSLTNNMHHKLLHQKTLLSYQELLQTWLPTLKEWDKCKLIVIGKSSISPFDANQSPPIFQNWKEILFMACFIQRHQHHTRAAFVWIISRHHSILFTMLFQCWRTTLIQQAIHISMIILSQALS